MIAALASVVAAVGSAVASGAARFIALKFFLTTLFVVVLPILFNNFLVDILTTVFSKATSAVTGNMSSTTVQLTGLAGYIGDKLQLVLVVSILLGAVSVRWTLRVLRLV